MKERLKLLLDPAQLWFEEQLLPHYQKLEIREQRLVLAAGVLLPLMLIMFGLMLPLNDRQESLRSELSLIQAQATEAERLALFLTEHSAESKGNNGAASGNLLSRVERLARQTKVRGFMTRIKPQPSLQGDKQSLMVKIKNVPYDKVLGFIHALASQNVGLSSLKIQAATSAGLVHVNAVITSG